MLRIYLSYRPLDAPAHAGRLYDRLSVTFGRDSVIRNIDVPPGGDVDAVIKEAVSDADVMVVVIGPQWSTVRKLSGQRSLDDATDPVRLEIAAGLKSRMPVIPVLVGGAQFPSLDEFPPPISGLARHNAFQLAEDHWEEGIEKLTKAVSSIEPRKGRTDSTRPVGPAPTNSESPGGTNARDIFISYVEEDGTVASELATALRAQQRSTWTYEEDGVPGVSYLTQVFRAIDTCRAVVLIASAKSVKARQVIKEIEAAHERDKMLIAVRVGMTHQELTAANEIIRMAIGTSVTLPLDHQNVAGTAKRIARAIPPES